MRFPRRATSALALAAAGCLLVAPATAGAQEMSSFGVNLFGLGSNECGSVDPVDGTVTPDLSWCDDFSDVMDDAFTAESWDQTEDRTNAWTDGQDWADADRVAYGDDEDDPDATDFAEVAQLCSHGGSTVDHTNLVYKSFFLMGDDESGENCTPNTEDDLLFGDLGGGDLEVVIFNTCEGAQWGVWNNTGYFDANEVDGSLNTWLGFHGSSYDSEEDLDRFEDYVVDSFDNGLGDNFLDEMHRNPWGADNEQCPVAITFCEAANDCDTQYEWGGFEDRHKVAAGDLKLLSSIYYIGNCDPDDGIQLPN